MNKPSKFLITTADERSWRNDRPVLCLGAWCRTYNRADAWAKLDAEVAPYHWDDRNKLHNDYYYLRELYEVLLIELADKLNSFHGTQHTYRYWRILIGPWLLYFTQMLFDRWSMIQYVINNYQIDGTLILDFISEEMCPNDTEDFRNMYHTDAWNHYLYSKILNNWTDVYCEEVKSDKNKIHKCEGKDKSTRKTLSIVFNQLIRRLRNLLIQGLSKILQLMSRGNDTFFISTTLPLKQDILLQLSLSQVPQINRQVPAPTIVYDHSVRKKFLMNTEIHKGFDNCLRTMISNQIPKIYLEGYGTLQSVVDKLPWPTLPKAIFTSGSYNGDDVFKGWAGLRVESGVPLLIGQHGGNLGTALWTSSEDHEIAISDRYLTWGWSDTNSKQFPVGALKHIGKSDGVWDPEGTLLLVSSVMPRYSYVMGSFTVSVVQTELNLDDQYKFVRGLRKDIFENLVVRPFMPDWDWAQPERWQDQFSGIQVDSTRGPIEPLIRESRLYVATYNATTFLDSLSLNIPTIMFWNPKHWELRSSAEPYFEKLRQVGIFHSYPEDAANKVSEIWDNVHEWWNRVDVQEARKIFCNRYARLPQKPIKELKQAITTTKQ